MLICSCFGSGELSDREGLTAGDLVVTGINIPEGGVWELNRRIRISFNHPLDPSSIGFDSVQLLPVSSALGGRPVLGTFELEVGSEGRILVFNPTCPTNEDGTDGAFLPGGYEYLIQLPTHSTYGQNVLRDTGGHQLKTGITRHFFSPSPPSQPLYLDDNPNPPSVIDIGWPQRLNAFTDPEPVIGITFDQSIDGRAANLNDTRLYIEYSDDTLSNIANPTFLNALRVPGFWQLMENCSSTGALVNFNVSGILPVDRGLRLVVESSFSDIVGQANNDQWTSTVHQTPTLESIYSGATFGWVETDETIDEFRDWFDDQSLLDPDASLTAPAAEFDQGVMRASFDYPGQYVSPDQDFYMDESSKEVSTDGQQLISDSNNRYFTMYNGVMYVDDFYVAQGSTIRATGSNPLIIYAQGKVEIYGIINVSGLNSHWPTSLNSPQFPEGPIMGQCGGGLGGISSKQGAIETLRGDPGNGAFGATGKGGGGGEGGVQQRSNIGSSFTETAHVMAAGGGGGTFANTSNVSIWKYDWSNAERPSAVDNSGPDHLHQYQNLWPDGYWRGPEERMDPKHPMHFMHETWLDAYFPAELPIYGGEDGMRSPSFKAPTDPNNFDITNPPTLPHGIYGMEDEMIDIVNPGDTQNAAGFDPDWNVTEDPLNWPDPLVQVASPIDMGHPTNGPDPGRKGVSIFSDDGTTANDFWGNRLNDDGTVTRGELLTPWAGSGGGASGDSQTMSRVVGGVIVPLPDVFPARPFPPGSGYYRKGAPGGGGGGQFQIMAIGAIIIGDNATIMANGGIGHGGESTIYTYGQVSGSGGGSGGHIIIHSATAIDLSQIYLGAASTPLDLVNLTPEIVIEAEGGRRGWAGAWNSRIGNSSIYDGNGDLQYGRGGAGGNGVIQFHVPDPANDYFWPTLARNGITAYLQPGGGAFLTDRLEVVLDFFTSPKPVALLPIFSPSSQFQSKWIDTGMAYLHLDGLGDYPVWSDSDFSFKGIDTSSGDVESSGGMVDLLPTMLTAPASSGVFAAASLTIPNAAAVWNGLEDFLRHPAALVGYSVLPDSSSMNELVIVDAEYDRLLDVLILTTDIDEGSMNALVGANWSIRPRFFTVATTGLRDGLPPSAKVNVQFQASDDPDSGTISPSPTTWTSDMSQLDGLRFLRYRVIFDIDATGAGISSSNPRPELDYIKVPFKW